MSERNYDEVPFTSIVPNVGGNDMLRVTREPIDGVRRFSVRDIIAATCAPTNGEEPWFDVPLMTQAELLPFMSEFTFSGRGQKPEPVVSIQGCFTLMMNLSGSHALLFRARSARILVRFFAGDKTLITESCIGDDKKEEVAKPPSSDARSTRSRRAGARYVPY